MVTRRPRPAGAPTTHSYNPADVSSVAAPPPEPAVAPPSRPPRRGRATLWRDIIEVLLLAVALYVVIAFALQTVRVDGTSMVPTLDDSDLLFADKLSYHLHGPGRGDIVVLQPPDDPTKDFIKRVVGLPGDVIEIDGNYKNTHHAAVLVKPDGKGPWQKIDEPYLPDQTKDPWTEQTFCCDQGGHFTAQPQALTIPQDEYFVLGDNRNASKDSRIIGLIPRQNILARAWIRIWPASHLGFLGRGPSLAAASLGVPALLLTPRRRRRRRRRAG